MIIQELLEKPYEDYMTIDRISLKCDYCDKIFERTKRSVERSNGNVKKDSCDDKECKKKKQKEVNLKLYGNSNYFLTSQFKEKQRKKVLELYGTEEYFSSEDSKIKRKNKFLEKYGVDNPMKNKEVRKKQEESCEKKYGKKNYAQTKEFKEKYVQTSLKNFGCDYPMQNESLIKIREETCQKKYGKKNYTQTDEYWQNRIAICREKYGVDHPSQLKENREKAKKTCQKRYGESNYSKTEESKLRNKSHFMKKFGVPSPLCLKENQKYGKTQTEIMDWLNSFEKCNFKNNSYEVLKGKEIDLYDKNLNIGIEYSGLYWHTELSPQPRNRDYHYEKYKRCLENNIKLITIFEDEWKYKKEICKSLLKSKLGMYDKRTQARKCKIESIEKKEFKEFCDKNHLLGSNNLGLVYFSLKHENELLGVISLGRHPRKKEELILDRLCFKINVQIIGGTGKLFKKCIEWAKQNNYDKIVSWSDNRWSQGNVYKEIGFELEKELGPNYSYVNLKKPYFRESKQSKKKSNINCPPDKTEREFMAEQGYARIWDCGKKTWVYKF